jgi:malonyl CoA-acyl carrier protein transacylase/phosphopantetheinyl transferase
LKEGAKGLAFLFPGEGSQYPGMLADLCLHFPEVRRMFDIADRIALELGEDVPPSEHLYNRRPEGGEDLWSTATAVNLVLTSQRALHRLLTRLGLVPDAVLGHSSGEILALAAAGVLQADRVLEEQLGRLGEIFRGFESSGDVPEARLVAVATARERVESLCRDVGAWDVVVAIDNCPHQVVLAGPPADVDRVVARLREENIPQEMLPFERAYHTASFQSVLGPIAEFFARSTFRRPSVPIYSCATHLRMPDDPEAIRQLAIAQWTQTVAFRETIETMHADGLRLFVDVGARGNLAGFVEDILRDKPAFAIAANLPRRGGLTQLNHLVAATFAQGAALNTDNLYARRRPRPVDWNATDQPARTMVELKVGFPEMRLSPDLVARLHRKTAVMDAGPPNASEMPVQNGHSALDITSESPAPLTLPPFGERDWLRGEPLGYRGFASPNDGRDQQEGSQNGAPHHDRVCPPATQRDDAMQHFQETMQTFLQTQQEVMAAYLGAPIGNLLESPHLEEEKPILVHANGRDYPQDWAPLSSLVDTANFEPGLTITSSSQPGPWAGELTRLVCGAEVETVLILDSRDDPLAEHHTLGGRRTSALDPNLKGLPVLPFAAMAEMTAQVAALVVTPGLFLTGLEQVRAHKWVRYEEAPVHLSLRGQRVSGNGDERVWVGIFNRGVERRDEASRPVFEAVAIFRESFPTPPEASQLGLDNPRTSQFTVDSVYGEGWLFHGPPLQALVRIGQFSEQGIDGSIRVLPWEPLLKAGRSPRFHIDPIVLDVFTHLLGCWGLDFFDEGDVVFPLRMEKLEILGERPSVGTDVECRISVREIQRHRIRVEAEVVRPDGTVWMRIRDWQDWRFRWPGRYRDAFRQAQNYFVGEELAMNNPAKSAAPEARVVWLEPPVDMGRPVWRDVLEQTQLGPLERATFLANAGTDARRSHQLWGRIAAKEAARRIWSSAGLPATYPADLAVVDDDRGRPRLIRVDQPADLSMPAISIAHADGVAVALASDAPNASVGIDVELIVDRADGFEDSAFTSGERLLLAQGLGSKRTEWIARFLCAKGAAAKASGIGPAAGPAGAEVIEADPDSGVMHVRLAPEISRNEANLANPIRVISCRRAKYAWAWTLGKGVET